MLQDDYRKLYKKLNPKWQDSVAIYRNLILDSINKDSVVLEAGCGFSDSYRDIYSKAKQVIGVDINKKFLELNRSLDIKIQSNLENIPQVKSNSVDLIISSWVFEHLERPDRVFAEFSRVLKHGGKVIFLTPNKLNYVVILNRIIPNFLRKFFVGKMAKNLVTDPMKTFYKVNSVAGIKKYAKRNGLKLEGVILNGDPTYIAINRLFFYKGVLIEKFHNIPFLRGFRTHLIGVLEKE